MKKIFSFSLILFLTVASCPIMVYGQAAWRTNLQKYINGKLLKTDGGYGWEDQPDSHSTVCFAVTGTLFDIGQLPANKAQLAEFIRTHHPQRGPNKEAGPSGSELRNLTYEQIQAILWLGGDVSSFAGMVSGWKSQAGLLANYEDHKYPVMYQEAMILICQKLVNVPLTDRIAYIDYYQSHRRPNGSFNNSPTAAGGDGNILNTYWSLYAMAALGAPKAQTVETTEWLQNCQLKSGGFTHQPNPQIGINDDVIYTWAGIKALQLLGTKPKNVQAAIAYLVSLHNADGGFGDRPGLHSTPIATYYAIDALKVLNGFSALDKAAMSKPLSVSNPDFTGYKVYTVQFQGQGGGSPLEAVMLADRLKIQLWGAKYPAKGWVEEAQKIADAKKVPVTFFLADEPHDNDVTVDGMGSFNHVLDYIAPAKYPIHYSDNATYDELKKTTLKQLKDVNGGLLLQVSNNEPLARLLIDESINSNLGYLGISTVHFGQNFAFWLPYLNEYRYRLPLVTLQDAHGIEAWWWADELTNHRTLFIAKEPTYEAMIKALKNNWVVGVRHDSVSNFKTRMLGGIEAARKFLISKEPSWKWWSTPDKLIRPQVAITIIGKEDQYEAGKPETDLNIRIRCRWNSVREALKTPAATLQELKVDGQVVLAKDTVIKNKRGLIADAYYLYVWGNPTKGQHRIEATIKNLSTNAVETYTQTYVQN
ncbi:MAG: prenyltransferase/squalene oxidase repeat-containing protein [Mucilaginibacter sp.]|uniref:prenyltransferase/squalene oxidase repeat-containing protein n=1 Tax=Mucilaginibacter sp. TaxID=1882438 RepID=UPI0031A81579